MTVSVRSLGSGSSGNSIVVESAGVSLLIDCGLSATAIGRGLKTSGASIEALTAVLISHEHIDHVRGLPRVLKHEVPLLTTRGTHSALDITGAVFHPFKIALPFALRSDVTITAIGVSHDAAEPCGFHIEISGSRITILTDLGSPDDALCEWIAESDLIILEANHDREMLVRGPYPLQLKKRVLSPVGHLSNDDCGKLLRRALQDTRRSRTIWLAHLSEINNRPEVAEATVNAALSETRVEHDVRALPRYESGGVWRSCSGDTVQNDSTQLNLFRTH